MRPATYPFVSRTSSRASGRAGAPRAPRRAREGERRMRRTTANERGAPAGAWLLLPAFVVALAGWALADTPPGGTVTLSAVRSWSAPENTRVVFDFSRAVTPVAPDSGVSSELVVALPGEAVTLGSGVPTLLPVADGVVDSVAIEAGAPGARFHVWFRDT